MWCYIKIAKNEVKTVYKNNALVAQLDRALDYESRGQGFESSRAHHIQCGSLIQKTEILIVTNF
jgi:hypothetical protein